MNINDYISTRRVNNHITPAIVCKDGFIISVQASEYHYCSPRDNDGPYSKFEIGYPNRKEPLLMPYAEDKSKPTDTVYGYVPESVVKEVIEKHGGFACSGTIG